MPRKPKTPATTIRSMIRLSVPVDHATYAKLCAIAAVRDLDRGEFCAQILTRAVAGCAIVDRVREVPAIAESTIEAA